MKKILSLGVAAAIASMTAIAASAAVEPTVIDGDFTEGSTVTIELQAYGVDSVEFGCNVAVEGLEFVGAENGVGTGMYNAETGVFGWYDMTAPEDGDVLVTLTYNVTAAAGEKASFAIAAREGSEGFIDATLNIEEDVVEVTTGGDEGGEDLGGDEGGEDLGGDEGGEDLGGDIIDGGDEGGEDLGGEEGGTGDEGTAGDDAGSTEGTEDGNKAENPDTGIALAVVPAVLAGAAIVVSKKRK